MSEEAITDTLFRTLDKLRQVEEENMFLKYQIKEITNIINQKWN